MLFVVLGITSAMTWTDLSESADAVLEYVTKIVNYPFPAETEGEYKIYQSLSGYHNQINDNVAFVGIAGCSFEEIDNIETALIKLNNAQLEAQNTSFTKLTSCYAIYLSTSQHSKINDCLFSEIDKAGGIYLDGCTDVTVSECSFQKITSRFDNCSAMIAHNSAYVLLKNSYFSDCNIMASIVTISNTRTCTIDSCSFVDNYHVLPGGLFTCSVEDMTIQNCNFINNTTPTFSAAILSLYSKTNLNRILCQNNRVVAAGADTIPPVIGNLMFMSSSVAITVIQNFNVKAKRRSTLLKNLFFDNNTKSPDAPVISVGVDVFDLFYEGSQYEIQGVLESTGTKDMQFLIDDHMAKDFENVSIGVNTLSYYQTNIAPLNYSVSYDSGTFQPIIREKTIRIYGAYTPSNVLGNIAVFTMDSTTFEECSITDQGHPDNIYVMKINLGRNGAVSINKCVFEDNQASSAILLITDAKAVTISNTNFISNIAKRCSGALVYNVEHVSITGCTFGKNTVFNDGALAIFNANNASIAQCTFRKNEAYTGTAALVLDNTTCTILDCTFNRNELNLERDTLEDYYFDEPTKESITQKHSELEIYFNKIIGVSVTIINHSSVTFSNTAFISSDVNSEVGEPLVEVGALDVYSDNSSVVGIIKTCTNKQRSASQGLLTYKDACEVSKYAEIREYAKPLEQNITAYKLINSNGKWIVEKSVRPSMISGPDAFTIIVNSTGTSNPPKEEDDSNAGQSKTNTVIIVCSICVTIVVLCAAAIYWLRKPPELDEDENEDKLEGLIEANERQETQANEEIEMKV